MRDFISLSAAIVFAVVLLAGCNTIQNENRSANVTTTAPTPVAATTPMAAATSHTHNVPNDGVRRITPAELQALVVKGEAIVIDVRSQDAYQRGHIKGARLIPAEQIASRAGELPRDKMIVTYCA